MINKIISETVDHLISAAPASDPRWGGSDSNLPVTLGLFDLAMFDFSAAACAVQNIISYSGGLMKICILRSSRRRDTYPILKFSSDATNKVCT